MHKIRHLIILCLVVFTPVATGQSLENIGIIKEEGAKVVSFILDDSTSVPLSAGRPLFSLCLNGKYYESDDVESGLTGSRFVMIFPEGVEA